MSDRFISYKNKLTLALTSIHPLVWLLLIAFIAYHQVILFTYGLKWDNLDTVLPWRTLVSDSLKHGIYPFWNPYQAGGYPIYGDLRSVFNPEIWLLGSTVGYSVYTLHVLMFTYVYLAGVGAYKLCLYLTDHKLISFWGAIAFMLSGYIVQQFQDLPRIVAAAWLPFVLLYFIKLQKIPSLKHALLSALFYYLLMSGGYLPISFMIFYIIIVFFIYFTFSNFKRKDYKQIYKQVLYTAITAVIMLILLLPNIITFIEVSDYVSRFGNGLTLEAASFGHLPILSLSSLLIPLSSIHLPYLFTDLSMRNVYFGIIPLLFFAISIYKLKHPFKWILLSIGIVFLFASFGNESFVHEFLFKHVPLMNLFRFPSYFSLISIVCFIALASMYLKTNPTSRKLILLLSTASLFVLILVITILLIWYTKDITFTFFDFSLPFHDRLSNATWVEHTIIHSVIQSIVLIGFIVSLKFVQKGRPIIFHLIVFTLIEMLISVQLQIHYTGLNKHSGVEMYNEIEMQPKTFLLPNTDTSIETNAKDQKFKTGFWLNTNIFSKTVSQESFNSFELKSQDSLFDSYKNLVSSIDSSPLAFVTNNVFTESELLQDSAKVLCPNSVYVSDSILAIFSDSIQKPMAYELKVTKFYPNNFIFNVEANQKALFALTQTYYPGWQLYVNGVEQNIVPVNVKYMGAIINSGTNIIEFKFSNNKVQYSHYISLIVFVLLVLSILFLIYKRNRFIVLSATLFLIVIVLIWAVINISRNKNIMQLPEDISSEISSKSVKTTCIINTDIDSGILDSKDVYNTRFENDSDYTLFFRTHKLNNDTVVLYNYRTKLPMRLIGILYRDYDLASYKKDNMYSRFEFVKTNHRNLQAYNVYDTVQLESNTGEDSSMKIGPDIEYCCKYSFGSESLISNSPYIFFSALVKKLDSNESSFIFQHQSRIEDSHWERILTQDFCNDTINWYPVCFVSRIDFHYDSEDEFKVLIQNKNANFCVKDIRVIIPKQRF